MTAIQRVVGALCVALATGAHAAELTVDTGQDVDLLLHPAGNGDGQCALREAIHSANQHTALASGDCPVVGSWLEPVVVGITVSHVLLTVPGEDDTNARGDLDVLTSLLIVGTSPRSTIDGGGDDGIGERVLHILGEPGNPVAHNVDLTRLAITGGRSSGPGGGIYTQSAQTWLDDVHVVDNRALNADQAWGGGIGNVGGLLFVTRSHVDGNHSSAGGGGISSGFGYLRLEASTVSNNVSYGQATAAFTGQAGGVEIAKNTDVDYFPPSVLVNSTISGNAVLSVPGSTHDSGGGLTAIFSDVRLLNMTIVENTAPRAGGVLFEYVGSWSAANTIIQDNVSTLEPGNCKFRLAGTSQLPQTGPNLTNVGDASCFASKRGAALLGPLAPHGGPTPTHALLAGNNPAIDAGHSDGCRNEAGALLPTDQRGHARHVAGGIESFVDCDIGAFEYAPGEPESE